MKKVLWAFNLLALVTAVPGSVRPRQAIELQCMAQSYLEIPRVIANCTNIMLQDIALPSNVALDLTTLQPNTVVTFAGITVSLVIPPC